MPRLALVLGVVALGLLAWPGDRWWIVIAVNAVVLAVVALDVARCSSPSTVVVGREHPDAVRVGDDVTIAWTLQNTSRSTSDVTVTDALWPSFGAQRRTVRCAIEGGRAVRTSTPCRPTRRGRFPLDEVTVRIVAPWRLVARQSSRIVPSTMLVLPAYPSRDEIRRRMRMPRLFDTGTRARRAPGGGTEFDQLREYRPDDEFRRIDWPATVRHQRPIVKQFRVERNQSVMMLLDNGRTMAGTVAGSTRVEHAMDAALALTETAVHIGDRAALVAFDRQVRAVVPPNSSRTQLARVAEAMYLLEPDLVESAYLPAFSVAVARVRRRSLYVVFTDLVAASVDLSLLPALPRLVRTHIVVVAAVRDPVVDRWADGGEHQWASEAYREAAAVATLHERERAAGRLRAAGAIVIDAAPGRLGVELVDTYLDLKASGRL
jgi:uncharacterized protein (DUF58 family)